MIFGEADNAPCSCPPDPATSPGVVSGVKKGIAATSLLLWTRRLDELPSRPRPKHDFGTPRSALAAADQAGRAASPTWTPERGTSRLSLARNRAGKIHRIVSVERKGLDSHWRSREHGLAPTSRTKAEGKSKGYWGARLSIRSCLYSLEGWIPQRDEWLVVLRLSGGVAAM